MAFLGLGKSLRRLANAATLEEQVSCSAKGVLGFLEFKTNIPE
jgi:hypothetical protein